MAVHADFPAVLQFAVFAATTTFNTARLLLWAFLVGVAWYEIIEKKHEAPKRPGRVKTILPARQVPLTAATLSQHDEEERTKRWPAHIPPMAGVSEMGSDESIDQWSIWEGDAAGHGAPPHQQEHFSAPSPVAPGTPTAIHVSPANGLPNGLSDPVDRDEQHVLSKTTLGGNTDMVKEPPKEVIRHGPGGEKHKVKKPFLARKVEKWFVAPYAQKYERVGYLMYKGAMRVERGVNNLSKDLDASIRVAGVAAVDRVEEKMMKWIKFFGCVGLLTVVLLPMPSVHISLGVM